MASFDTASKKQLETNPQDFVHLCFRFGAEKLQSDPHLNKEKPVYIDIIKQSIENKNYIETQQ